MAACLLILLSLLELSFAMGTGMMRNARTPKTAYKMVADGSTQEEPRGGPAIGKGSVHHVVIDTDGHVEEYPERVNEEGEQAPEEHFPCPNFFLDDDKQKLSTVGDAKAIFKSYCTMHGHSEEECEDVTKDRFNKQGQDSTLFTPDDDFCESLNNVQQVKDRKADRARWMGMWNALVALSQQRRFVSQEVQSLNETGQLPEATLLDRRQRIRSINADMWKLHRQLGLKLHEKKRLSAKEWLDVIIERLEKAQGPHGHQYKACLQMVVESTQESDRADLNKDWDRLWTALVPKCKERKTSSAHPSPIDCDLLPRQMSLQKKLLGPDELKTPEPFCAILVDAALPIDDEPPCLRLMEDISHEFLADGTRQNDGWPAIIGESGFDHAFHEACELEQHSLPEGPSCDDRLRSVHKFKKTKKYPKMSDLLVDLCPALGFPLKKDYMHNTALQTLHSRSTTRGLYREEFRIAAHKTHGSNNYNKVMTSSELSSAAQMFACDREAVTFEVGVSAGSVVTLGASVVHGVGYRGAVLDSNICRYSWGDLVTVGFGMSSSVDFVDVGVSAAFGAFANTGGIPGDAVAAGVEICFIFCVQGGYIRDAMSSRYLGTYIEVSLSAGAMPDIGIGISQVYSHAAYTVGPSNGQMRFDQCDCFPGSSLVQTSAGTKLMSDLQVGDSVLSVDSSGNIVFDDVYFFGHADSSTKMMYHVFKVSGMSTPLKMSARHFLYKCPVHGSACLWPDRMHTYAKDVVIGDYVWVAGSMEKAVLQKVVTVSEQMETGLYNPYTLSGPIVVNGVVASSHSNWILDDMAPAAWSRYLPHVYQALFLPGRWLYYLGGRDAASWLDMNNPQSIPEGRGPHFLIFCFVVCLMVPWMLRWMVAGNSKRAIVMHGALHPPQPVPEQA